MFEEAEHLQLPEDSFAAHEALKDIRQFFQGHSPTIPRICHRPVNYKENALSIRICAERERERDSFPDYSYVPSIFLSTHFEKSVLTRLYFVKSFVNAFIFFFF